jgi:hypothetical protein
VSAVALLLSDSTSRPISDYALTELQVRDVLHHPVLTGLYSRDDWSHPGPMFFYAIAPVYWLTGGASIAMNLAALAINAVVVAGIAIFAWRRGGSLMLLCALLATALVMRTLGAEFLFDPWNNYIVTLAFGLLLVTVWSAVCGDRWALPVATVAASFLAQTHVGFVALAIPLLAIAAAWFAIAGLWRGTAPDRRITTLWVLLASGAIFVVLWLPPLLDLVLHERPNLQRIVHYFRTSDDPSHPIGSGWRIVSGQFGGLPEWLTEKRTDIVGYGESPFLAGPPFPWLLVPFVLAAGTLWWQRRRDEARARYFAVVIALAFGLGVVAIARTLGPLLDYRLRWTWMIGWAAFLLIVWTAVDLLVRSRPGTRRVVVGTLVVAVLGVTVVNGVTAATAGPPWDADSRVMGEITPEVIEHLGSPDGQVVLTDNLSDAAWYTRGLVLALERAGIDARVPAEREALFGAHRVVDADAPVSARLKVLKDDDIAAALQDPGLVLVARWRPDPESDYARQLRARARIDREYDEGRLTQREYVRRVNAVMEGPPDNPVAKDLAVFAEVDPTR